MGILEWAEQNWFQFLQTASLLVGFFTAIHSVRTDTKERKIGNLFALTNAHREIWSKLYERRALSRVLLVSVNLRREPVTAEEELFVHTLILHLRAAFKARKLGMQFDDDAVAADIRQFLNRSIPRAVWEKSKIFQDGDFVQFVERALDSCDIMERAA
ncbi:MAG: hypothetical protein K8R23_01280 [Chthoniobacter sp.]|nr:hypothetical protein [Chthoniobacter sp.]